MVKERTMPNFIVTTKNVWHEEFLVEAENEEDAREKFDNMQYEELENSQQSNEFEYVEDIHSVKPE